jgi:hypothetical protein
MGESESREDASGGDHQRERARVAAGLAEAALAEHHRTGDPQQFEAYQEHERAVDLHRRFAVVLDEVRERLAAYED